MLHAICQTQSYRCLQPRLQPADSAYITLLLAEATSTTQPKKHPPQQRSHGKTNPLEHPANHHVLPYYLNLLYFSLDIDRSHRCCSRPLWSASRSCSRPRQEPGRPRREDGSAARTLEAVRTRARPGMGQGSSTAPPSVDRRGTTREAARRAAREARTVRFDPCVRVVLVPSRCDIDRATKHAVWWGRADVRQFRRNAYHFFQEHGTLSVVSNEELRQAGPPPGMPPPPFLRADSGNVGGGSAAFPKDPSTRRRRYHQRRVPCATGRHAAPGPGSAGEPQREDCEGRKTVSEPGPEIAADREAIDGMAEAQNAGRRQVYCEHESRFTSVAFVVL